MTEADWMACEAPRPMLESRPEGAYPDRRYRLFAVACCRRIWHALIQVRGDQERLAVAVAERFADGAATLAELDAVSARLRELVGDNDSATAAAITCWVREFAPDNPVDMRALAADVAEYTVNALKWDVVENDSGRYPVEAKQQLAAELRVLGVRIPTALDEDENPDDVLAAELGKAEVRAQAALVRDIFGNPFRPVPFSQSWRTHTVAALAGRMYESRDFSAMPILADALQDAGCDSSDILDHCRGSGPHVRGCWCVDLVLGKE